MRTVQLGPTREKGKQQPITDGENVYTCTRCDVCVCVCVCASVREREREGGGGERGEGQDHRQHLRDRFHSRKDQNPTQTHR